MEEQSSSTQPLLSPWKYQLTNSSTSLSSSSFIADEADIKPVESIRDFFREFSLESKKLWYLAAPAIFTAICQYSLGAITQVFAGHVGTVELAAVSVENSVIAGFSFGLLNAEVAVDGLSICMNILGWTIMVALGFNAAISVRVSNELGAAHPRTAKFSVVVATVTSMLVGLAMALVLIIARKQYPDLFSSSTEVKQLVYSLTPMLGTSIVINSLQPTLSGVAIGAGWQAYVAYVNIGCYYFFGIPLGLVLGYATDMGVTGIWDGMLAGTVLQTCILIWMIYRTNWNKEVNNMHSAF
ncbi:hypothetical protein RHSIM_Rhsim12G0110800 [Rhododendron simsii]|uniref:Uncharacterized protein n=1 Tax=Rhododendron simsii TaxID=118357 RepID=A0A834G7W2_RHOSS|nr:hypothetical protein RHSIM_Rhsim12G0110800 [Rhododendron simsii]